MLFSLVDCSACILVKCLYPMSAVIGMMIYVDQSSLPQKKPQRPIAKGDRERIK